MIKTKYGNAKLNETGHYRISSRKEGNNGKYLHRLIWEEHYGEIPEGYVIHHKNENPQDNSISNLELMSKTNHGRIHNIGEKNPNYGKPLPPEHRRKISENHPDLSGEKNGMYGKQHKLSSRLLMSNGRNKSGILNVSKKKNSSCKNGWCWQYKYYEDRKVKTIMSVNLMTLKEKVLAKGFEWIELEGGDESEVCNQ